MKNLLALLLLVPLLVFGGPRLGGKPHPGFAYATLPANFQIFMAPSSHSDGNCTPGDGQTGGTTINNAGSGGSTVGDRLTTGNLWARKYIQGIHMIVRWACIETSQGVYSDTAMNIMIDQAAAYAGGGAGGKFGLDIIARSFGGTATNSNMPSYVYNDNGSSCPTYGGTYPHCGEVASGSSYAIIWGNANVVTRFKALIDHMATSYGPNSSRPAQYVTLDEVNVGTGLTVGNTGFANEAALVAGWEDLMYYCQAAFAPTPCFAKFNFLTGDNYPTSTSLNGIISDCIAKTSPTPCYFSQELAMPSPYDYRFPQPSGTTITNINITQWAERSKEFPSSRARYWNTEWGGSSTWNANYDPKDGTAFLRYLAYLTSGYVDAGTPVFWTISNTNGTSTTSGSWSGIGAQITSGFLR